MNHSKKQYEIIADGQSLVGFFYRGKPLPFFDNGAGPLFLHKTSNNLVCVRARNFEEALDILVEEWPDLWMVGNPEHLEQLTEKYADEHNFVFSITDGRDHENISYP